MSACAFRYEGSVCGCSETAHPPGSSHAFVEPPAPEPQLGGDEAERIADEVMANWPKHNQPLMRVGVRDLVLVGVKAGRARGIEEGKAVCPHICGHCADKNTRIADAIAKETPK